MAGNGRYVTWKGFTAVMIPLVAGLLTAATWMLSAHADHPHKDAVPQREFQHVIRELKEIKVELRLLRQDVAKQ